MYINIARSFFGQEKPTKKPIKSALVGFLVVML